MICSQLRRELGLFGRSLVGFLDISVSRAMACFFDCFKVRDNRHRHRHHPSPYLVSDSSSSKNREAVISGNQLSSLFLSEENEDSPIKYSNSNSFGSPRYTKELKDEAKFLKACGTIVETPAEIRKASKSFLGSPRDDRDSKTSKSKLDNRPDDPHTPIKNLEDWGKASDSIEHTPSSCTTSELNTQQISVHPVEDSETGSVITGVDVHNSSPGNLMTKVPSWQSAAEIHCRTKSVRFECDINESPRRLSFGNERGKVKENDPSGNRSVSKPSPYPTPLQLSDEMQTPGTVFPANLDIFPNGKARIRSQYVYSVLNPVESASHLKKAMKEEDSIPERFSELREFIEQPENSTPISERNVKASTRHKDLMVEASLSDWLKPVSTHDDGRKFGAVNRPTRLGAGDRPIIGMVAAHWNEDEPAQISPKEWDGNGIPNSTTKYKEDQKVSWHATPFEERLEKALSEESVVTRKNFQGKLVAFDEEDDTALSMMKSSIQPSSVVSF